jgi:hypothetical protein
MDTTFSASNPKAPAINLDLVKALHVLLRKARAGEIIGLEIRCLKRTGESCRKTIGVVRRAEQTSPQQLAFWPADSLSEQLIADLTLLRR